MKKRALSLFLAFLMLLTVMPLAVFSVGAEENVEATEVTYKDLYVKDATVMLDVFGDDVSLENGKWVDATTGAEVATLKGSAVQYSGSFEQAVNGKTGAETEYVLTTYQKENVNHKGEKYRVTTDIYTDSTLAAVTNKTLTISGKKYTVTYTKTTVEGWDGEKYTTDVPVSFGGWYIDEDGALTYDIPDFYTKFGLTPNETTFWHELRVGSQLERLPDDEYTIEILMSAGTLTDTDGFGYTAFDRIANQGEGRWVYSMHFGPLSLYNRGGSEKSPQLGGSAWGSNGNTYFIYSSFLRSGSSYRLGATLMNRTAFNVQGSTVAITKAQAGEGVYTYTPYQNGTAAGTGFTTGTPAYIPDTSVTGTGKAVALLRDTPASIYTFRIYDKALTVEQINQNHFADLCGYYGVSGEKIAFAMSDATVLATLVNEYASVKLGETSKAAIEASITAIEESIALKDTKAYASLYAPGASVILTACNAANDGSIDLENGKGTWENLVDGALFEMEGEFSTFTGLDGVDYHTGWELGDKFVGFDMSWQAEKTHGIKIPSSYLGDEYTVEMVAKVNSLIVDNSGVIGGYQDANGNGEFDKGDKPQLWTDIMVGKNYRLHHKFNATYNGETMMQTLSPNQLASGYHAYGNQNGNWLKTTTFTTTFSGKIVNYFVTEDLSEDKTTVDLLWQVYSASNVIAAQGKDANNPNGITYSRDVYTTEGSTTTFFSNLPADVYAIRVYNRVLTDAERIQNHFADLVAITGAELDIDAFNALSATAKAAAYNAVKDIAVEDATAQVVTAAIKKAFDTADLLTGKGVSAKYEGESNGLRTEYAIDLSDALALEADGFIVEIGAILGVAKYGEKVKWTYSDLTLDAIEEKAENMSSILVYASSNEMGASFTYTEYKAGDSAGFAYTVGFGDDAATASADADKYTAEFVFRGYVKLTDERGNVTVSYVDPTESWVDGVSLYDVAKILVAGDYAGNEMLGAVIDKVENPAE